MQNLFSGSLPPDPPLGERVHLHLVLSSRACFRRILKLTRSCSVLPPFSKCRTSLLTFVAIFLLLVDVDASALLLTFSIFE